MNKYLPLEQDKKTKQALKKRLRTFSQVSSLSVGIHTNYMEPQKLLFHLKQLKTLRTLTLSQIPLADS